jgi:tetratricopeptide (TPR) repeat protein
VPPNRSDLQQSFQAAQALQQAGRLAEAERAWAALAADAPDHAGVQANLAMVLWQLGRVADAEAACARALDLDPGMIQAQAVYAACAEARDDIAAAIERYGRALAIKPDLVTAVHGLANLHARTGNYAEARKHAERMAELAPEAAEAWAALGAIRLADGDFDGADTALAEATRLDPSHAGARANRGAVAAKRRDWNGALRHAEAALALDDRLVQAHANRGTALSSLGRPADAEVAFNRALALDAENADALYNRSLMWLKQGRWADAWPGYEARGRLRDMAPWRRDFQVPRWEGAMAPDKTVLIQTEQGIGDTIMMARYLPPAALRVHRLVVECHPQLLDLLAAMPGLPENASLVAAGDALPAFDFYLPVMSLAGVFETTPETVPWNGPYLAAPRTAGVELPELQAGGVESQPKNTSQSIKVGITWAGNPNHADDAVRSVPLADLAPALDVEGCAFFAMQFGVDSDEIAASGFAGKMENLASRFSDFAATAAWVDEMDLVITVCTSMAHLAGAMGKPTWIMVGADAEWRWLEERTDTPWYPTARLFRQADGGDWKSVAADVACALKELAR